MKILFARPKYFSEAIAWTTTVNCILALRTFEYPRGNPRPILSLIYLFFIYIICWTGALRVHDKYYANVRLMKLEYVMYQLVTIVIIMSVIIKMLLGWWYTKKFKTCHKKLFEIDKTLRQLGLTVNYDGVYFVTIGIISAWVTFVFVVCTVVFIHLQTRTDVLTSLYFILISIYAFGVHTINIFEFYMFTRCLQIKFELVNQFLRDNLSMKEMKVGIFKMKDYAKIVDAKQRKQTLSMKTIFRWRQRVQPRMKVSIFEKQVVSQNESHFPSQVTTQFQSVPRIRSQRHKFTTTQCQRRKHLLQVIKQVHLELCRISKLLCTILGVQVAWEIGIIIMALTGTLYNLCVRYVMNQQKVKNVVEQTFVLVSVCCLHIIKAVILNYGCKNTAYEGNKTIEIIHAIYDCDTDMQEEIQQFGIQILQSPVTFSAFGLTLDNRVLSMILKTVTIYIVIVLQVSNSLESNNAIEYSHFEEL